MADGDQRLLTAADDDFHAPPDDSWWFHETCWFWFFVPERRLGGWLYNYVRPNIGVAGGGCWIWDDTTFLHWEVPYFANYSNLRLPETRDLRDFTFPSGVSVRALEPLAAYRLTYADDAVVELDPEYRAVAEPWVAVDEHGAPRHLDQLGRVTGRLSLRDETLHVDCLAIRDRSWGLRSERWKLGGGYGYTNAAASPDLSFLSIGDDAAVSGHLVADGRRSDLTRGTRAVDRHPAHGHPTRVVIEAVDAEGRDLHAVGQPVSRMAMPIPGVHGVVWTSLVEWTINGVAAWGEDQEPWPIMTWSSRRRRGEL